MRISAAGMEGLMISQYTHYYTMISHIHIFFPIQPHEVHKCPPYGGHSRFYSVDLSEYAFTEFGLQYDLSVGDGACE